VKRSCLFSVESRSPGTVLLRGERKARCEEAFSQEVKIAEREERMELQGILPDATVAHLRVLPEVLDDMEGMLHLCSDG